MKVKPVKTEVQQRAALRANEQRRAEHAFEVLKELVTKHGDDPISMELDLQDLHLLKVQLLHKIKNQHIKDERYAKYKATQARLNTEGDY